MARMTWMVCVALAGLSLGLTALAAPPRDSKPAPAQDPDAGLEPLPQDEDGNPLGLPMPVDSDSVDSDANYDDSDSYEADSSGETYNDDDSSTYDESDADTDAVEEEEEVLEESDEPEVEVIRERYPDGSVYIEREVTQDALGNYINHGSWKTWDKSGQPVAQGQYRHNQRHGEWIRWYRSAREAELLNKPPYQQFPIPFISQAIFVNDQLHGPWTIYDGRKRKISQWEFVEGRRHGKSIWWYANGRKMREADYKEGDLEGKLVEWTPDGQVARASTYQGGRKLDVKTSYHTGKQKRSEGVYLFGKEVVQTPDDWWTAKLLTTSRQGKDEKHGPWRSWYPNGQLQLEGEYRHDLPVGHFTWWHANGQKALEGSYVEGRQQGDWTWWYGNGQKSIRGEYASGTPTGRWIWWQEDGKVNQSGDLSHAEGVVIDSPALPPLAEDAQPKAPSLKRNAPSLKPSPAARSATRPAPAQPPKQSSRQGSPPGTRQGARSASQPSQKATPWPLYRNSAPYRR